MLTIVRNPHLAHKNHRSGGVDTAVCFLFPRTTRTTTADQQHPLRTTAAAGVTTLLGGLLGTDQGKKNGWMYVFWWGVLSKDKDTSDSFIF